jgi:hypothetical protein
MFGSPGARARPPLIITSLFGARRSLQLSSSPLELVRGDSGKLIVNFGASRSAVLPTVEPGLTFGFWTGAGTLTVNTIGGALLIFPDGSAPTGVVIPAGGSMIAVSDGSNWLIFAPTINQILASTTVKGVVELATAAEYRANTAGALGLTPAEVWAAMAEVTLTDGVTITPDFSTGFDFTVTLAGNRTLANGTNLKVGQKGRFRVVQDATGGRTLAYSTDYEFASGAAIVLSTAANAQDVIYYDILAAGRVLLTVGAKAIA